MKLGGALLGLFVVLGVIGPWIAPYDPALIDLAHRFASPSAAHWLGTDSKGVDALSQLVYGARSALVIAASVVAFTAVVGTALGLAAGWLGGAVDEAIMRVVDVLLAFPGILLNIAIVATVARPSLGLTIVALCANGWVGYARLVRGQVLALRNREFVQAAVALGAGHRRIVWRHLAPNVLAPVLVQASLQLGDVILVEASLAFLGLGPQVDYTWGAMLDQGTTFLWKPGFAHYALAPGLAIMAVVIGANLLGDALRDKADPRSRPRPQGPPRGRA